MCWGELGVWGKSTKSMRQNGYLSQWMLLRKLMDSTGENIVGKCTHYAKNGCRPVKERNVKDELWVPIVVQWKWTQLVSMRTWVRSLASLSGLKIWCCHDLLPRLAAVALIWPLAWELPYALCAALKSKNKNQKKTSFKANRRTIGTYICDFGVEWTWTKLPKHRA